MNKIVPFKTYYDRVKAIGNIGTFLLYTSGLMSIAVLIIDKSSFANKEIFQNYLNSLLAVFSVFYFFSNIVQSYFFQNAEFHRKNDFTDNSFKTKLSEKNSVNYFSNDNIENGILKLGVNCFENSFFTRNISGKMMIKESIKSTVILCLFILVAAVTDTRIFMTLLKMALPLSIIQKTVKLLILHQKVSKVFFAFKLIFTDVHEAKRPSLIINNVINYEKSLSWACITLDSKVFNRMNAELSIEWERIKNEHSL
ncbi:MAG: hypothetical protein A2W98_01850 [Bacteroidetes bacterium GWF2_33_38]|nr:MAG: hypothetical protein A2W98_01850 [Bacteroidetes bacterium GWF2_33_38]